MTDVFRRYFGKPDFLRIDDNVGSLLTKTHAAALGDPYLSLPAPFVDLLF